MKLNLAVSFIGAGLAIAATLPLASQTTTDAQLEAACRTTEVTMPASCACTVTKAREAGLSDAELASLFRDDGHSDPVAPAQYSRFWQVKAQCIADATMASMGISASNPLPGVPAHMRPGQPLGGTPTAARPAPANRTVTVPAPAPAPTQSAAVSQSGECDPGPFSSPNDTAICGDTGVLETTLLFDRELENYPALLSELKQRAEATFAEVSRGRTQRDRYGYVVTWDLASASGNLVSVTGADGDTSRGRLGGSTSLLWDADANRFIDWRDVFVSGVWDGRISRDYCAALRARAREVNQSGDPTVATCPDLDRLTVALVEPETGGKKLRFFASAGVLASYATSALYDGVELPLDTARLALVRPAYREALGAPSQTAVAAAPALLDRLGTVALGPPHFVGAPECANEFYLQPADIGNPGSIADIRALIELSAGRIMVTGAGMLGSDDWRSGIVLDGEFLDLTEGPWDEQLQRSSFSGGGLNIHYEERASWAEVSYGGWGHGELVVRSEGETSRIPVLQQAWQCT